MASVVTGCLLTILSWMLIRLNFFGLGCHMPLLYWAAVVCVSVMKVSHQVTMLISLASRSHRSWVSTNTSQVLRQSVFIRSASSKEFDDPWSSTPWRRSSMPLSCRLWITTATSCLPDHLSTYLTCFNVLWMLQLVSSLAHTSSIKAYPVYCMMNCTDSTFLSECSTSWQLRFTSAFKIKRRSTWSTTASQSSMLPVDRVWDSASRHFLTVLWFRRSTFSRWAFTVGGPMAWNSLPDNLHDPSPCSSSFRRGLKTVNLYVSWDTNAFSAIEMIHDIALHKFNIDTDIDIWPVESCSNLKRC